MKKGKKYSRILSLLLAFVMVFTMMPAVAWADDSTTVINENNNSVAVAFTVVDCLEHNVERMRKELTVTPGLAKQYFPEGQYGGSVGMNTEVGENDVTPIDVLVAAHLDAYGDAFAENPGKYITGFDYASKMFEAESEITWTANGIMPYAETEYGNTGYAINQYIVQDGDEICFYRMSYYADPGNVYASFDSMEETINVGEELTLHLGYCATMAYYDSTFPAANAEIFYMDENGTLGDSTDLFTDENGEVTISFDIAGTYYLTCSGNVTYLADNDWDGIPETETPGALSPAYCKVTVVGSESEEPANAAPALKVEASATATREVGSTYELDLSAIFEDSDGDALTYYVKVGTGEYTAIEGSNYAYDAKTAGTYTLTFKANDGTVDSQEYVVTLTVKSAGTDPTTVFDGRWISSNSAADVNQVIISGVSVTEKTWNGNVCEIILDSNTARDSEVTISVTASHAPPQAGGINAWSMLNISVNGVKIDKPAQSGGKTSTIVALDNGQLDIEISVSVQSPVTKTFKLKVEDGHVHSYGDWEKVDENTHKKTCTSTEGDCLAPTITESHKWGTPVEEPIVENGAPIGTKITKICTECSAANVTENITASNIVAVVVPDGAEATLYRQKNGVYYYFDQYPAYFTAENEDDTTTYYFSANTKDGTWVCRVTKEDELTKIIYLDWGATKVSVTYSENDIEPTDRVDYTTQATGSGTVGEDGVFLNINSQNFLTMEVNAEKTLKAYRVWELVQSYLNCIVIPDFHYTIISGEDCIRLDDKPSPSAGDGDWKTLTAVREGTAVIEVTYDAVELKGPRDMHYPGVYGASDPARTGLMIVQVGGQVADVDFGIQSKSGQGSITYSENYAKPWDAEFDTLYFTGESGELKLSPTVNDGDVEKVEVSGDKGGSWTELTAKDGVYTAPIVSGNNIIKVTATTGISYQVVRGDKIEVAVTEVNDGSDGDGLIEAGEKVRVTLKGLHQPIPKMSGNYNPGYNNKVYATYEFNGQRIRTAGKQYTFVSEGNYFDIVIPEDTESETYTLTEGYICLGQFGLEDLSDGGDNHRNIPDEGCGTRNVDGNGNVRETLHTRSILPDIEITVYQPVSPNNPPVAAPDSTSSVAQGVALPINPETLFTDADNDNLTFTVTVKYGEEAAGEATAATKDYKFTPEKEGTYYLTFTANDGKEGIVTHTVTLTVTKAPTGETTGPAFDVDNPAGYVTVSFVDNAVRKSGETGIKIPNALGTIVPATRVPYEKDDTIADVTTRLLDAYDIGYIASPHTQYGWYLSKITGFTVNNTYYDQMGEFDAGNGSGWMITHNNVFIGQSAGNVTVKNGDRIEWKFTCQLGQDIGNPYWDDKKEEEEVKDVTTSGGAVGGAGAAAGDAVTTTTPTEVTVIGSTATATVIKENVTETIKQATENKSAEIVLQVSANDTKGAAGIKVQLDTTTVKDVVNKTEAALTVKTENATVTLDRETLKTVAAEAAGSTVTLEVIEVAVPTAAHKGAAGENGQIIQLVIKSGDKIISSFNEGKATVTVEIPTKLDGKKVAAIHIGDDGKIEHLKGQEVTVGGKKHYRFDTPHFSTFALVDADEIGLEAEEQTMSAEEVKALLADLSPAARSSKTAKGIKVTLKLDAGDKAIIEALEAEGFTVKYKFYRSTKKTSKYQAKLTSKKASYTNTGGKKGTKYYYKARVQVYDADGQLVAQTELKQCKYASRKWTK